MRLMSAVVPKLCTTDLSNLKNIDGAYKMKLKTSYTQKHSKKCFLYYKQRHCRLHTVKEFNITNLGYLIVPYGLNIHSVQHYSYWLFKSPSCHMILLDM